jgi:uncharacterized protein (TIGR02145 family)
MKKILFFLTLFLLGAGMSWAQNVAKIGTTEYATLDAAITNATSGDVIEIIAATCDISASAVIPANVTIQGQGKTATTMTVVTSGDGLKITNPNVTIKDMSIDGNNVSDADWYSVINVKADNVLIDNVVMTGGPMATWGASIQVSNLSTPATFTVSNSDISGAGRGVFRENCSANIVITNCDLDATYPFNIDGGSGGTVTVTGGALHGNTSYGGVDQVTFENVTFSKGTTNDYDRVFPYKNTVFINCNMDSQFQLVPKAQNLDVVLDDCTKGGVLITSENVMEMFPEPSGTGVYSLYTANTTTVNEVVLVDNQTKLDDAVTTAVANSKTNVLAKLIDSFDYDGNICGPASGTLNINGDGKILSLANFGPVDMTVTTTSGVNTYTYTCTNGCSVTLNNPVLALGENSSITTPAQTSAFVAVSGYSLVETNNGDGTYTYTITAIAADAVAQIGSTTYTSLADAVTAANDGETIVLLRDVELTATQQIAKSITLDLAYKTISGGVTNLLSLNADGLTVTIQRGTITNTGTCCVRNPNNSILNIENCTITANDYAVRNTGTGTLNIENSTLKATLSNKSYTVANTSTGTINVTDCQITANRYCVRNVNGTVNVTRGSMKSTNTANGVNVYNTGTGVINISDVDAITAVSKVALSATAGTINVENVMLISATENTVNAKTEGTINIINSNVTATTSAIYNEGASATVTINGGTVNVVPESAGDNYGIYCVAGVTNVLGSTTITDNALTTAAVYCNTGIFNMSAGTISATNTCITTTDMSYVHLTGGTYSEDVSGEMCDHGYAAFANGTTPETWTVVPAYNIYYVANNSTTEKDTAYVPKAEPTHTVQVNAFTNTLSFRAWNTKADGTGTEFVPGATMTVDSDTTLYAQWGKVFNVDNATFYDDLQTAINAATAGDSLVVLADMNIVETGDAGRIKVNKSIVINGEKHLITTKATRGLGLENGSNLDVTLRNFYMTCNNVTNQGSDAIRGVQIYNTSAGSHLLLDSCRIVVSGINDRGYALNFPGGADNVTVTVKNSYIQGWAALNCYSRNSTFIFDNDTLYGLNTQSTSTYDNFNVFTIDGNSSTMGSNNNVSISKSVIIAEQRGTCTEGVFCCQNKATSNTIVVDCETKIVNGKGTDAQDVRDKLLITNTNCPYNSYTLPLTDEQKAILASDAAGRRFGLTDTGDEVCGTMRMTKVSRQARNGRCAQDIGFHLYFDTENYANHVIAGSSAKLTLIEDVILQKDETVDVNGKFLLFFKDWYNSNITHNIINNGHHIILAEGTSCATDVEVPDSIFAVPSGFDGKIVHKSVSGQVHKFEYYAAPYVAINVNRDIKYTSLQTATDSVNTGDTVRLLRNITYTTTSDRVIITDKNLTLDLYGDTISTSFSGTIAGQYAAIQLKSGYLEVKDTKGDGVIRATNRGSAVLVGTSTSAGGNASFTLTSGKLEGAAASNTWGLYVVLNDGDSVVLNGGEVAATGAGPALYNKQGKVIVNDGRIQGNGKAVYNYYAYNNTYFPTTILNGGEIYGGNNNPCVDNNGGTFIMNGGTITIAGTTGISSGTSYGRNGELYINGGVINDEGLTTNTINTIAGSKGKITITGGTFNLSGDNANVININGQDTVTVTGGTFAATGANDIIFKGAGNGAVFTINDATPNAAAMFNLGSDDSCVVNGGKFTATDSMFTNAGKLTLNGGVYTQSSDKAITNTGTFTVNDGWYSESLTRATRGISRWLNGDDISYYGTPELHLIKVPADSVVAAGLTGDYWQLGNTITYDANGGTGSESQDKVKDETVQLSDGTGFSYEGHTLYRWNTADDENGDDYALGADYSNNVDLKLYAVWRLNLDMEMDSTDVVCYGENNGTDTVKIIGGEAPFQLVLSGTALSENDTVKSLMDRTYIYENLKPGSYTVTLTDVLGKDTIKGTFTISQPDTLVITSLTVPEKPCPLMGTGAYNVSVATTGGNGGNTYTWGEAAVAVNADATTVIPGADDRDSTYKVSVTVTDSKGCTATATTTFSVSPVIADDGTIHSNTKMTVDTIKFGIYQGCDTVIKDYGTPTFTFTNPAITEDILDTIYNDVATNFPDSIFPVGTSIITWTAIDTCGHSVTCEQAVIIYQQPCPNAVDKENNSYPAVRIGCTCWMAENLKSTKYSDGRDIENVMTYVNSDYPNEAENASIYGHLYDWYAAVDTAINSIASVAHKDSLGKRVQGVCPAGWYLPNEKDLADLYSYDTKDLRSTDLWIEGNGTNATGFHAVPSGFFNCSTGRYEELKGECIYWSCHSVYDKVTGAIISYVCDRLMSNSMEMCNGLSVRCLLITEPQD